MRSIALFPSFTVQACLGIFFLLLFLFRFYFILLFFLSLLSMVSSIITVKKHCQIKLRRFPKNILVTGKTPFFVLGPCCTHHPICLNIGNMKMMFFQS